MHKPEREGITGRALLVMGSTTALLWLIWAGVVLLLILAQGCGNVDDAGETPDFDAGVLVDAGDDSETDSGILDAGDEDASPAPTTDAGADRCEARQALWCSFGCIGTIPLYPECAELHCECEAP